MIYLHLTILKSGQASGMDELGRDFGVGVCEFAFYSGMNLQVISAALISGRPRRIQSLGAFATNHIPNSSGMKHLLRVRYKKSNLSKFIV